MAFMDRRIGITFGVDWAEIALFIHGGLVYQHPCTEQLTAYGGFSVGGAPGVDLFREVNIGLEGGLKYYPDPDFHLQFLARVSSRRATKPASSRPVLSTVDAPFEFRIGAGSNALYMGIPAYAIAGIAFGVWLTTLDHH
jgi:hypothetical protein